MNKVLSYLNLTFSILILLIQSNIALYILKTRQAEYAYSFANPKPNGLTNLFLYFGGIFQFPILIISATLFIISITFFIKRRGKLSILAAFLWIINLIFGIIFL